jgi:hypothetical protein
MSINRDDFAQTCVEDALIIGVDPHCLVAFAELLSGIKDDSDGDRIGPFRVTLVDWKANGSDANFQITLQDDDINDPMMQCMYAALQTFRAQESLRSTLGRYPSPSELYAGWPKNPPATDDAVQTALDDTKGLIDSAVDAALAGMNGGAPVGDINLNAVPAGRQGMATLIVNAFAAANYGKAQQIAAVANAIAESNLNPNARLTTATEDSVGLFQLNMKGGVGAGHSADELKDPAKNIDLIIREANKAADFKAAATLQAAVAAFVTKIERPANQAGEIIKRFTIAQKLAV